MFSLNCLNKDSKDKNMFVPNDVSCQNELCNVDDVKTVSSSFPVKAVNCVSESSMSE